ncbi:hypothetical protein D4R75_04405, partial [bacterium]
CCREPNQSRRRRRHRRQNLQWSRETCQCVCIVAGHVQADRRRSQASL